MLHLETKPMGVDIVCKWLLRHPPSLQYLLFLRLHSPPVSAWFSVLPPGSAPPPHCFSPVSNYPCLHCLLRPSESLFTVMSSFATVGGVSVCPYPTPPPTRLTSLLAFLLWRKSCARLYFCGLSFLITHRLLRVTTTRIRRQGVFWDRCQS